MDNYIIVITALLPLTALMVVTQVNPYHALIMRGILGAIAALAYTVLGAPDVALTEALVGTLLAITLYAIAVRSSLVLRVGVLKDDLETEQLQQLTQTLRKVFKKYHMQVELVPCLDSESLHQALFDKEVHAISEQSAGAMYTTTRLPRIHEILHPELAQIHLSSISSGEAYL